MQHQVHIHEKYEYLFKKKNIPLTVFAVAMALQRNPSVAEAMLEANHEICSHGLRWIDYSGVPEEVERLHIAEAVKIIKEITGEMTCINC